MHNPYEGFLQAYAELSKKNYDLKEETATGHCGRCGHAFKYDPSFEPTCDRCGSKGLGVDDSRPDGCFDMIIKPL